MTLLVNHYANDLRLSDVEIDAHNAQYQHVLKLHGFPSKWKEIRDHLKIMNKEIVTKNRKNVTLINWRSLRGMPTNGQDKILIGTQLDVTLHIHNSMLKIPREYDSSTNASVSSQAHSRFTNSHSS